MAHIEKTNSTDSEFLASVLGILEEWNDGFKQKKPHNKTFKKIQLPNLPLFQNSIIPAAMEGIYTAKPNLSPTRCSGQESLY
jgi:hypothetical protein